jgi:hypothetical protein
LTRCFGGAILALLAVLALAPTAFGDVLVTDDRTSQTFSTFDYAGSPYACSDPCGLTFRMRRECNNGTIWIIRDASGTAITVQSVRGPWHYTFPSLGTFSLWASSQYQDQFNQCTDYGLLEIHVIDTTAPETTVVSGPRAVTHIPVRSFGFTASEAGARFECHFDALPFAPCISPLVSQPLADGPHTFAVRAIDATGNADPTPATIAFAVRRLVVAATLRRA